MTEDEALENVKKIHDCLDRIRQDFRANPNSYTVFAIEYLKILGAMFSVMKYIVERIADTGGDDGDWWKR